MFLKLLLLFTLVPIAELALLIELGKATSLGTTIAVVLVTGALGAWLARREGLRTWISIQDSLRGGDIPSDALVEGLLIFVAGAVLVTPGLLTDAVGFGLLIRPIRRMVARRLSASFRSSVTVTHVSPGVGPGVGPGSGFSPGTRPGPMTGPAHGYDIIDMEDDAR